jgi:hypothetical protein
MGTILSPVAKVAGFVISGPMFRTSNAVPANNSGRRIFTAISCFTFS